MTLFRGWVTIVCDTPEEADTVMSKRLAHDEDYGFPYTIDGFGIEPADIDVTPDGW